MSKTSAPSSVTSISNSGGRRQVAELARSIPPLRASAPKNARSRMEAGKPKKAKPVRLGPTPERAAKGDFLAPKAIDAPYVCVAPIERLFRDGKLAPTKDNVRENFALWQAAQRLKRHYDQKNAIGVRAQDLNRVTGRGSSEDLNRDEAWVEHNKHFEIARRLMGWTSAHPKRGSACIVIAVVCDEKTVTEAADEFMVPARAEVMKAAAMDRLREGLFTLALHWREI